MNDRIVLLCAEVKGSLKLKIDLVLTNL